MEILVILFLFIPAVIFLLFVAPMWLIFHYQSKRKMTKQLSDAEQNELESLADQTKDMAKRIETLEAILDAETPNWRASSGDRP